MRDEAVQQPRKGHGRLNDSRAAGSAGGRLQEGTRTPPPGGGIYVTQPTAVPVNLGVFYRAAVWQDKAAIQGTDHAVQIKR